MGNIIYMKIQSHQKWLHEGSPGYVINLGDLDRSGIGPAIEMRACLWQLAMNTKMLKSRHWLTRVLTSLRSTIVR